MEDLNNICKHCGYEKGVHSMLNYYCPLDDPYEMKTQHDFDLDIFFEPESPKEHNDTLQ